MKCIAIDDEPLALKLLTHYCKRIPFIQLLGAYTDPLEGLSSVRAEQPDLIFLDMHMPDISGIHIAQTVAKNTLIIITTAHKEYAVEGFELDVVDYLLKPFDFERFLKACNKAEQRFQATAKHSVPTAIAADETIVFKYDYQTVRLPLHFILYIEACNNYIKIITPDKMYMPTMTMKTICKQLPKDRFFRIHKSFIVAANKIKSFKSEQVMIDHKPIPVGRSYRKNFLEQMENLKI